MRRIGKILQGVLPVAVFGLFCYLSYLFVKRYPHEGEWDWIATFLGVFLGAAVSLALHPVLHEMGHVLFGKIAGLRLVSFRAGLLAYEKGRLRLSRYSAGGECVMLPPTPENAAKKRRIFAWGGILGSLLFALCLCWAPFFWSLPAPLFAGLNTAFLSALYSFLSNVIPSEGREKTDGQVLLASYQNAPESVVEAAVFAAQGYLLKGKTPAEIPEELLYGLPAISEGEEAFAALTQLRFLRAGLLGNEEEFKRQLLRMEGFWQELEGQAYQVILCELVYGFSLVNEREKAEEFRAHMECDCAQFAPTYHRASYAFYRLIRGDSERAEAALTHAKNLAESCALPGEKETENALLSLL